MSAIIARDCQGGDTAAKYVLNTAIAHRLFTSSLIREFRTTIHLFGSRSMKGSLLGASVLKAL